MPLTSQQILDAEADLADLSAIVNGGPDDDIATRTGGVVPSLQKLLAAVLEPYGKVTTAANRAALAGMVTMFPAVMIDNGIPRVFAFNNTDLSTLVAEDVLQGMYVAPAADPTGASGAWVGQHNGEVFPEYWGALGNCTAVGVGHDDYAAFEGARKFLARLGGTGTLRLMKKRYRIAQRLAYTDPINIKGEGWYSNSGFVAGTAYNLFNSQNRGSSLIFDANVAGMIFYSVTDNNDAAAVAASFAALGSGSPEYKFQSARGSSLRDVMVMGGGGNTITAHGIEVRTVVFFDRVMIYQFAGDGLRVDTDTGASATPYGNSDNSIFNWVRVSEVGMNGIRTRGNDANIISFNNCDTTLCGGYGVVEGGMLGNYYTAHHFSVNNQSFGQSTAQRTALIAEFPQLSDQYEGAARCVGAVNTSSFNDCYSETSLGNKSRVMVPSSVTNGTMAQGGNMTTDSTGKVEGIGGRISRGQLHYVNNVDPTKLVGFNMGVTGGTGGDAFSWGSLEENADGYHQSWQMKYGYLGDKWWNINGYGSVFVNPISFPTVNSVLNIRGGASVYGPAFCHGYFLGGPSFGPVQYRGFAGAMPAAGGYVQGDRIDNSAPAAGNVVMWRRLTTSAAHVLGVDWEPLYPLTFALAKIAARADDASVIPAAAPAGGVGTAAGGWDTAANRDAAIATINGLRTAVSNLKTELNDLLAKMRASGILT